MSAALRAAMRTRRRAPRLAPHLLAVDVGNSKTEAVLVRAGRELGRWRLDDRGTPAAAGLRAWAAAMRAACELGARRVPVLVSSVAPARAAGIVRELRRAGLRSPHLVGWRDPWPFEIAVREPQTIGVDRLGNVAGLVALGLRRAVAVDLGTAVTLDVLRDGSFRGGLILPGFEIAARALHEHTAKLPLVEVGGPVPLVGTDTCAALRAGVYHGTLQGSLAIARLLAARLGAGARIVASGGGGALLREAAPEEVRHVPDLMFLGLRALAARLWVR